MLAFQRLPVGVRMAVFRHLNAASFLIGEDRRGAEPSNVTNEVAL